MKKFSAQIFGQLDERGLTLIEQVMTLFVVGLVVLAWLNLFRVVTPGSIKSKVYLRAQNLAMTKMEDMKSLAANMTMANQWSSLTFSATALEYGNTQVQRFENRNFTWRVTSTYASVSILAASLTPQPGPTPVTYVTNTVVLNSEVYWTERNSPIYVSMTGYVSNYRQ